MERCALSHGPFEKIRKGEGIYFASLKKIAASLGVQPATLEVGYAPPQGMRKVLRLKITGDLTLEEVDKRLRAVEEKVGTRYEIEVEMVMKGSTIIDLNMDERDADALMKAFEAGKLQSLGVVAVHEVEAEKAEQKPVVPVEEKVEPLWKRVPYSRLLTLASIACSLTGFLPINSLPFYLGGLIGSIASGVLNRKHRLWLILSVIGLSRLVPGDMDFLPGPGPQSYALPGFGKAGVQICYEIIFSGQVVDRHNRPDFLFNPSNDAWFGAWGPPQHLAQARMRAMEEGVPIIRSTPTGISAVIDADGTIRNHLPWHQAGAMSAPLPAPLSPTPFARYGNLLPFLFAILLTAISIAVRRRTR